MMNSTKIVGSDLTRSMLMSGSTEVWCAISDESDEEAMLDHYGNDFTAYIVSFDNDYFYCNHGRAWAFAVPIRIVALGQSPIEEEFSPVNMAI
tara:strand:- start:808 stop:1086 length:279 start_codon:yes stop_codon:yes gene_type:complete